MAAVLKLELEYFMIFFGTFFVGYSTLGIVRAYMIRPANAIPSVKMFCIGSLAVIIFSYGYFLRYPLFMIAGSLLPLASIAWLLFKPGSRDEFVSDVRELESQAPAFESHGPAPGAGGEPATAVQALRDQGKG